MLDEGSFVEGEANWLKEIVDNRSLELFQEANLETFRRFRNVEMFFINEQRFNKKTVTERDEDVARNILQEAENANIREEQIRKKTRGNKPNMADPRIGSHYYPYTINDKEIKSALEWFKMLRNNNISSGGLVLAEMTNLSADLYICGTDKEAAKREFFKNEPAIPIKEDDAVYASVAGEGGKPKNSNPFNFSDFVIRLVERNHPVVKLVPNENSRGESSSGFSPLSGIDGFGQRLGQKHKNFINGIKKLSGSFNEIYQQRVQK